MDLPVLYESLTIPERKLVREEYIRLQKGLCSYCGMLLSESPDASVACKSVDRSLFPPKFFDWPIHLHHSHDTGLTIGAVHCYCNAVLWQYDGE
jgi:hypothetical protein